jgi:chromate transport protein ChrA
VQVFVATVFLLLPGVLMMIALAIGFVGLSALPEMRRAISGLLAAVVGIQAVTMYRFSQNSVRDRATFAVFALVLFAAVVLEWNAPLLVLLAGLFGAVVMARA